MWAPSVEHGDAVAEQDRLVDVVGDEHDGLVQLALQLEELLLQLGPHDRVDGAERLVHQQHGRVGGEGAGHADALLLAARQLGRVAVGVGRRQPDQLEQLERARLRDRFLSQPSRLGTVVTLSMHLAVGEQADLLDDVADAPPQLVRRQRHDVAVVDGDGARRGLDHAVHHPQLVVLPQPDDPTSTVISPVGMSIDR